MAGKGSEVGGRFEELQRILDGVKRSEHMIVSTYLLATKELSAAHCRRLICAVFPERDTRWIFLGIRRADDIFSGFVRGKLLDALIIGILCFLFSGMRGSEKLMGPSLRHLMGTDNFGRDIFSRVLKGAGSTLRIALGTVAIGAVIGTVIGALTGYFGGAVDEAFMVLQFRSSSIMRMSFRCCTLNRISVARLRMMWRMMLTSCSVKALFRLARFRFMCSVRSFTTERALSWIKSSSELRGLVVGL